MSTGLLLFTWFHTALSLVALLSGFIVVFALFKSDMANGWTRIFLGTMLATDVTGFMFPFTTFLPSHWTGVISLIFCGIVIYARYFARFAGAMRWVYAVGT